MLKLLTHICKQKHLPTFILIVFSLQKYSLLLLRSAVSSKIAKAISKTAVTCVEHFGCHCHAGLQSPLLGWSE